MDIANAFTYALLLAMGMKIIAIKLCRDLTGLGLKEAKDIVEATQPLDWFFDPANCTVRDMQAGLMSLLRKYAELVETAHGNIDYRERYETLLRRYNELDAETERLRTQMYDAQATARSAQQIVANQGDSIINLARAILAMAGQPHRSDDY